MRFSEMLDSARVDGGELVAECGDDWLQGRSLFGGLQAAIGARALRAVAQEPWPLRTLQTTFIAPVPAGRVRTKARVLRAGGSTVVAEARIVEGDETLACFVGVFGKPRASVVARTLSRPALEASTPKDFPYVPGMPATFFQHFRARWLRGGLPFSGYPLPEASIELALIDGGATDVAHVVALADYAPPVAFSMLEKFSPGSSLTWMLEFLQDDYARHALEHWRVDLEMTAARDGYTHQSGVLWAPDGSAAALSRQTMLVYG